MSAVLSASTTPDRKLREPFSPSRAMVLSTNPMSSARLRSVLAKTVASACVESVWLMATTT